MDILINSNYEGMLIREVLKNKLGYSVNLIKKLKFSPDGIRVMKTPPVRKAALAQ